MLWTFGLSPVAHTLRFQTAVFWSNPHDFGNGAVEL